MSIPISIKEEKPRDNSLFDLLGTMGQWILFTMVRETWIESYEELSPHLYPRPVLASGCPSPAALCPLLLWLKRAGRFPAVWQDEGRQVTKGCLEPWYVCVCVCVCYCLACVGLSTASTHRARFHLLPSGLWTMGSRISADSPTWWFMFLSFLICFCLGSLIHCKNWWSDACHRGPRLWRV